jgi:hypothetical protein
MKINAANLARLSKTSRAYISKITKQGKLPVIDGKYYDIEDQEINNFLVNHDITPDDINIFVLSLSEKKSKKITKPVKRLDVIPENDEVITEIKQPVEVDIKVLAENFLGKDNINNINLDALLNLKFKKILELGTRRKIRDIIDMSYKISQTKKIDTSTDQVRNTLIDIKLVDAKVFQYLDFLATQLLDYHASIIETEISKIKTNEETARFEIPKLHNENVTKLLKEAQKNIMANIKNLKREQELKKDEL